MLVHHRATPNIKFSTTHVYTCVKRDTIRVNSLAQEINAVLNWLGIESRPLDPKFFALTIRPLRLSQGTKASPLLPITSCRSMKRPLTVGIGSSLGSWSIRDGSRLSCCSGSGISSCWSSGLGRCSVRLNCSSSGLRGLSVRCRLGLCVCWLIWSSALGSCLCGSGGGRLGLVSGGLRSRVLFRLDFTGFFIREGKRKCISNNLYLTSCKKEELANALKRRSECSESRKWTT